MAPNILGARAMLALALAGLAILPSSLGGKYFKSFAGPYWVSLLKYNTCPEGEMNDPLGIINVRFHNFPKTHTEVQRVSGNATLFAPFGDNVTVIVDLETWANNEWKKNSIAKMTFRRCGCSCFRNFVTDFSHKMFGIDPKSTGTCTIDKGTYAITNSSVDWKFPGFPEFIYGLYRGKLKLFSGKRTLFCCIIEGRVNALPV